MVEKVVGKINRQQMEVLLSHAYGLMGSSCDNEIFRLKIHEASHADCENILKEIISDNEYRTRLLTITEPENLKDITTALASIYQLYCTVEGYFWTHVAGFPKTRKASKDAISAEMFKSTRRIIEKEDYKEPKEGEFEFRGFYLLVGQLQLEMAKAAAEKGLNNLARNLLWSGTDHLIKELYISPSEKFLHPGEGMRQSLTDLAFEGYDPVGKKLSSILNDPDTSIDRIAEMALDLLSQQGPQGKIVDKLIELAKGNVAYIRDKHITAKGGKTDEEKVELDMVIAKEEFLLLSEERLIAHQDSNLSALLKHAGSDALDIDDVNALNRIIERRKSSEAMHTP
ncbi:MAG: hypothetical protein M1504_01855 [Candidatus Marsarchaeota archaeon]|nr:hypothetical protein [Candidatus Marsarchaeota archaeon]